MKITIVFISIISLFLLFSIFVCAEDSGVDINIQVLPGLGKCEMVLSTENKSGSEITLKFPSGKKYDFVVLDPAGILIYQWSTGRMFIQAVQEQKIQSGSEINFKELWDYNDQSGNVIQPGIYLFQGILNTTPQPQETDLLEIDIRSHLIEKQAHITGKLRKILNTLYLLGDNGIVYNIETPGDDLLQLTNSKIEVSSYTVIPIPGSVDKKIIIYEYELR